MSAYPDTCGNKSGVIIANIAILILQKSSFQEEITKITARDVCKSHLTSTGAISQTTAKKLRVSSSICSLRVSYIIRDVNLTSHLAISLHRSNYIKDLSCKNCSSE
jgi:hypothetical protein